MRERHDRHAHARHPADLRREHPAGVDDDLGLDRPPLRLHAAHAAAAGASSTSIAVTRVCVKMRHAARPRAVGERRRQQRRVEVAVARQVGGAAHALGAHQREQLARLLGGDQLERQAERPRPRHLAQHLLLALGRARQADAAALAPSRSRACGRARPSPSSCRVSERLERSWPDEAGGVERRAARQLVAVEQHDVALAERREVVGDRRAAHAAADDHDARAVGQLTRPPSAHLRSQPLRVAPAPLRAAARSALPRSPRSRSRALTPCACTTPQAASRASESTRISLSSARLRVGRRLPLGRRSAGAPRRLVEARC